VVVDDGQWAGLDTSTSAPSQSPSAGTSPTTAATESPSSSSSS